LCVKRTEIDNSDAKSDRREGGGGEEKNSEVFQVEVEMRQALFMAAGGQRELVLLQRVVVLHLPVVAAAVLLLHLREGLRLGAPADAGGPVQHRLAVEHIAHLGAVVPVAAVAGALPVSQVLRRYVQHAAVVGHEPGVVRGLADDVVVLAVKRRHVSQVEAEVRHRERVEHDRRLLLILSGAISRGLVALLVFRQCRGAAAASEGLVRAGVDAALPELLLDTAVPEVLDLVVRPPWQVRRDLRPPA
jgi:hypothetical protein